MQPTWPDVEATSHERLVASAGHIASIFFPYLAPLVVYFLYRNQSRFVRVHALQAFFEALILGVVLFVIGAISLAFTLVKVWELVQTRGESFSWDLVWAALLKVTFTWVAVAVVSLWYTFSSMMQAIEAVHGKWKPSIVSGRIAKRSIEPRGSP
ncbi:MAG: DUF4870 domain-containing protein [Fimbriimonadaceae bacterium]|nr:DUF4870 domain-containing protein [Fimbriimonadaceae bacterium]